MATKTNYKSVTKQVNKLLKDVGISSAPVDLEAIANFLHLQVWFEELEDDVSGFLSVDSDKSVAVINANHHFNRQRFTLAHEIGHFCLHVGAEKESLFIDRKFAVHHRNHISSLGTVKKEREANLFASILLMPKSLISDEIKSSKFDFFDDSETYMLAKKFGVSEQALGFRLARLKYEVGE